MRNDGFKLVYICHQNACQFSNTVFIEKAQIQITEMVSYLKAEPMGNIRANALCLRKTNGLYNAAKKKDSRKSDNIYHQLALGEYIRG